MMALAGSRVLVTGAHGFLGLRVWAALEARGAVVVPASRRTGCDLRRPDDALTAVLDSRPDVVVHLAARVGGIGANMAQPGTFFRENALMGINIIEASRLSRARLVVVSTVCGYPKHCRVPFKEDDFWSGFPEETNAPYGIAKKALLVMCQGYRKEFGLRYAYLVPANLYGPGDNFDPASSHVIPAMIRRFAEAKKRHAAEVACWGTGRATRSFLHVDDAAEAVALAAARLDHDDLVNIPGGPEVSMADLAGLVASLVGYRGSITWDSTKPDGQPRRLIDGTRARDLMAWAPKIEYRDGLRGMVEWYLRTSVERTPEGSRTEAARP